MSVAQGLPDGPARFCRVGPPAGARSKAGGCSWVQWVGYGPCTCEAFVERGGSACGRSIVVGRCARETGLVGSRSSGAPFATARRFEVCMEWCPWLEEVYQRQDRAPMLCLRLPIRKLAVVVVVVVPEEASMAQSENNKVVIRDRGEHIHHACRPGLGGS